ncbi:signal protein [Corallococcus carmarthensis]|uniref:Signal protein n=1 Tax=Corallococcus carmarthensis TaxID=2316728 RepID=A0A3A8KJR5_9BACT|nr:signal protein [Corallococcus carmarthensis]NOK20508.1 signal protein [Corallococcus carmarthensis]RKH04565.1 signal protein [Corallococcus carmarthensis]
MPHAEDSRNASRPPIVRRTYLLDREFQLKYILLLTGMGAGSMLLFGVLAQQVNRMAAEGGLSGEETLWWLTGVATVGLGIALGLFGLLFTHRVAGPVHVMSLYVAALAAGRYPRLRPLRRKDELRAFFGRFSEAVDRIRQREADEALALEKALAVLKDVATTPESREAMATLEALRARKRQAVDTSAPPATFKSVA